MGIWWFFRKLCIHHAHIIYIASCYCVTSTVFFCSSSKGWLNPPLRFNDEPCRHKVLDLIGDLSLFAQFGNQGLPVAHIVAYKVWAFDSLVFPLLYSYLSIRLLLRHKCCILCNLIYPIRSFWTIWTIRSGLCGSLCKRSCMCSTILFPDLDYAQKTACAISMTFNAIDFYAWCRVAMLCMLVWHAA